MSFAMLAISRSATHSCKLTTMAINGSCTATEAAEKNYHDMDFFAMRHTLINFECILTESRPSPCKQIRVIANRNKKFSSVATISLLAIVFSK